MFLSSTSRHLLGLAVALAISSWADAATRQPVVVVTATRHAQTIDDSLAGVSVITREDIDRAATRDLVDLLRLQTGIDIVRSGGLGQQTSLFMRGSNSNHVLVLIDGVRIASANTGGYAWENLPLGQIERIEIVRGPRAAQWGSDAIGGVIQIFTRRGEGLDVTTLVGSHRTAGAEAGWGHRQPGHGYGLRVGYLDSEGFNAQNPNGFGFDPDDDGSLLRNLSGWGEWSLGEQRASASLLATDNVIEFDQGVSSVRHHTANLGLDGELSPQWSHELRLAHARESLETPAFFNAFETRRAQADWVHRVQRERQQWQFGLAWMHENGELLDTFSGSSTYDQTRSNRAAFVHWSVDRGAHQWELSARLDDNSAYGSELTSQAAWGWQLTDHWRLSANVGEGFRAPNFNELYAPGFGGYYAGNAFLNAETAESAELALQWRPDTSQRAELRVYRNDIDNLIAYAGGATFQAINIQRARIEGLEIHYGQTLGEWTVDANATWQDPRDLDSDLRLLRRPGRKASLQLGRPIGDRWDFGLEALGFSARRDFVGDLGGYGLINLNAQFAMTRNWVLEARLNNALDREYVEVDGFNTDDANGWLLLRWNPAE
ncbi:MAG TPA: TonB-dependent receptor [Aquimonas sp.]|nr:TonB-dependent receptor [Aquimonas sp.]